MSTKYYKTKWDGLTRQEKYDLAKEQENELAKFLINKCSFREIIPTRDSIITMSSEQNLILPDLMGIQNNDIECFIELKHKNRRMSYNDNGIDYDKAESYLKIQKRLNKRVLIVFIDDKNEWLEKYPYIDSWFKDENDNCTYYGNWIDKLHKETPENSVTITNGVGDKKVKCFPLKNMLKIEEIFKERQSTLNFNIIN